jgi:hypothetical protein
MGIWDSLMKTLGGGGAPAADYYDKLLQLAPGETMAFSASGRYVQGWGGQVTLGPQFLLALTSQGRLVMADMQTMNPSLGRHFNRGTVRVEDRGFLDQDGGFVSGRERYTVAGPTGSMERVRVLAFTPAQGAPFAVFVVESAAPQLVAWCGT